MNLILPQFFGDACKAGRNILWSLHVCFLPSHKMVYGLFF